jgi:hypothetical protein
MPKSLPHDTFALGLAASQSVALTFLCLTEQAERALKRKTS